MAAAQRKTEPVEWDDDYVRNIARHPLEKQAEAVWKKLDAVLAEATKLVGAYQQECDRVLAEQWPRRKVSEDPEAWEALPPPDGSDDPDTKSKRLENPPDGIHLRALVQTLHQIRESCPWVATWDEESAKHREPLLEQPDSEIISLVRLLDNYNVFGLQRADGTPRYLSASEIANISLLSDRWPALHPTNLYNAKEVRRKALKAVTAAIEAHGQPTWYDEKWKVVERSATAAPKATADATPTFTRGVSTGEGSSG
jgi:hypothetical protein